MYLWILSNCTKSQVNNWHIIIVTTLVITFIVDVHYYYYYRYYYYSNNIYFIPYGPKMANILKLLFSRKIYV